MREHARVEQGARDLSHVTRSKLKAKTRQPTPRGYNRLLGKLIVHIGQREALSFKCSQWFFFIMNAYEHKRNFAEFAAHWWNSDTGKKLNKPVSL